MEYTFSLVNMINGLIIAGGIGVCNLCFMQISASIHLQKVVRQYFQIFFSFIILYISTHLARQLMEGIPGSGIRFALYAVTFVEILAAGFMAHMISMLVMSVTAAKTNPKAGKTFTAVFTVLLAVHGLILIISCFAKNIYYFDAENLYHRADGYLLSNLCPLAMLIIDIVMLVRDGGSVDKQVRTAFWIYMIAPMAAMIVQGIFYGVQFIIFATVGAAVYMFAVIVQNQNAEYEKQRLENTRIETELNMASNIQAHMLPNIYPAFPDRPEFDIYATMTPAKEVGGDFYDFFLVDDDHLCMVMADVSGKGVPAALFMMASKIILANNAMLGKTPAQILTDANRSICSNNQEDMFVTVWLGILELSTGRLTAANAGHEYPVLKTPQGNFELVKDKHGFVVGGMDGVRYRQYELQLEPGSKLFLYTDGVPEATDSDKQMFGTDRMLTALNENPDVEPEAILKNVRKAVDGFVKDAEQFDDLTMMCMEYIGNTDLQEKQS